ncbi:MAG: hypothetical protein BroJett015_34920 [Chloroflexota bacterium]|nr:MAG: hypothetical protein BroJett015_34920 [Chloroflexota bacterium]
MGGATAVSPAVGVAVCPSAGENNTGAGTAAYVTKGGRVGGAGWVTAVPASLKRQASLENMVRIIKIVNGYLVSWFMIPPAKIMKDEL